MKPPPFDYHVPGTVCEAVGLLASLDNARVLAGGQSLMPMLNMRFAFPDHLVDINRVAALSGITVQRDTLRIGAMTRQRDLLDSVIVRERLPLLTEALTQVGHPATRNRGTVSGSLCHLDPAAELVACATALDATLEIASRDAIRMVPMAAFPLGFMTPDLAPHEMLVAIHIPLPPPGHGACFAEFSRRHGDFAIVSAAVVLTGGADGAVERARITVGGAAAVPQRMATAEAMLAGCRPDPALFADAAASCHIADPMDDAQVPGWYRRKLASVLVGRALQTACGRLSSSHISTLRHGRA